MVSLKTIVLQLIGLLNARSINNYEKEYHYVTGEIARLINDATFIVAGVHNEIKVNSAEIIRIIGDINSVINLCIRKYLKGEIVDAFYAFKVHWEKLQIPKYEEKMNNRVFYRMRKKTEKESEEYGPPDLLHIPINKRENVSNQRFSINGFPCLYASTSLYQCWEELRRPHLQNLYATGILLTDNLKILDLRLIRTIDNEKQLMAFLTRLPLIIACSIKTRDDKATFKAEYIISQIILHTIINKKNGIDGIIYSSMRKDYDYYNAEMNIEDCSKNENIVIPAKVTSVDNDYTDNLLKMIEIGQPLNCEQELIKGTVSLNASTLYEDTFFGQMEKQIVCTKICKAFNTQMLSVHNVSQRLEELKNSIRII